VDQLPIQRSELLKIGLADLAKVENDPGYRVDMLSWGYYSHGENICVCCLAGSVLIKTLNYQVDRSPFCSSSSTRFSTEFVENREQLHFLSAVGLLLEYSRVGFHDRIRSLINWYLHNPVFDNLPLHNYGHGGFPESQNILRIELVNQGYNV